MFTCAIVVGASVVVILGVLLFIFRVFRFIFIVVVGDVTAVVVFFDVVTVVVSVLYIIFIVSVVNVLPTFVFLVIGFKMLLLS